MAEEQEEFVAALHHMARKEYQGKAVHTDSQFSCGVFLRRSPHWILKGIIHWIQNFLTDNFNATEANYLYLVYPVVGIFLTGLFIRKVVRDDISHGVTKILYAIRVSKAVSSGIMYGLPFLLRPLPSVVVDRSVPKRRCADRFCHWFELAVFFVWTTRR